MHDRKGAEEQFDPEGLYTADGMAVLETGHRDGSEPDLLAEPTSPYSRHTYVCEVPIPSGHSRSGEVVSPGPVTNVRGLRKVASLLIGERLMGLAPKGSDRYVAAHAAGRTVLSYGELDRIYGSAEVGDESTPETLRTLRRSFASRMAAERDPGVRGKGQERLRNVVEHWAVETFGADAFERDEDGDLRPRPGTLEDYAVAPTRADSKLNMLYEFLRDNYSNKISKTELAATDDFLAATFGLQEDVRNGVDLSEGNKEKRAFEVPERLSTHENPEYATEFHPYVPITHYVSNKLLSFFVRDLPPFVADEYEGDEEGRGGGGVVMVSSVTGDMYHDLGLISTTDPIREGRKRVNQGVATAVALGCIDHGYGATLPRLMRMGEATENKEVTTTTGHGGTEAIMAMMVVDKILNQLPPEKLKDGLRLGFIGLGSIGSTAAAVIPEILYREFGIKIAVVNIFDNDQRKDKMKEFLAQLGTGALDVSDALRDGVFARGESVADVIKGSDIIISTVTATFDLKDRRSKQYLKLGRKDLRGKHIIDDSEPHSFKPEQVAKCGGRVYDVIGQALGTRTKVSLKRMTDSGYGHTMDNGWRDGFGCELELLALNYLRKDLRAQNKSEEEIALAIKEYAVTGPVTVDLALKWYRLFRHYDISPAPLQAFGKRYRGPLRLAA